jgi:hypothetical protein
MKPTPCYGPRCSQHPAAFYVTHNGERRAYCADCAQVFTDAVDAGSERYAVEAIKASSAPR